MRTQAERDERKVLWFSHALTLVLVVSLYYLAYRYPLQINSSTTSATYADTPLSLQIGKFVILGSIAAAMVLQALTASLRAPNVAAPWPLVAGLLWVIALFPILKGALGLGFDPVSIGAAFAIAAAMTTLQPYYRWEPERVGRVLTVFAVVVVLVEIYQYYSYRTTGRLPALAYEDSVSVRFGSILDDPNGIAVMTPMLVVAVWFGVRRKLVRYALIGGLFWTLLLTQSFTGMATTIGALALVLMLANRHRPNTIVVGIFIGAAGLIYGLQRYLDSQSFAETLKTKGGSIATRGDQVLNLDQIDFVQLIGLSSEFVKSESGWVHGLLNMGLLWSVAVLVLGWISFRHFAAAYRTAPTRAAAGTYLAVAAFQITYIVASANLQLVVVFPVSLLFATFIALSIMEPMFREPKVKKRRPGVRSAERETVMIGDRWVTQKVPAGQ